MKKFMLDASFVLELIAKRKYIDECTSFIEINDDKCFCISILTVHISYYFCKKLNIDLEILKNFIDSFEIIGMDSNDYYVALEIIRDGDLEDALQISSALNSFCEKFITIDKKLYKKYQNLIDIILIK